MVDLSVVIDADPVNSAVGLVSGLDQQSLSARRFDVIVVDRGLDENQREALRRVAHRRPNVRTLEGPDQLEAAITGEFVYPLTSGQRLFPEALERLLDFAREHELDLVAGRIVRRGRLPGPDLLADETDLTGAASARVPESTAVLAARSRVRIVDGHLVIDSEQAKVGVLSGYPSVAQLAPAEPDDDLPTVTISSSKAGWDSSELVISLSGTVDGALESRLGGELRPVVTARRLGTDLTFLVPVEGSVSSAELGDGAEGGDGGGKEAPAGWQATVRLAPLTGATGAPLPAGQWELDVAVCGRDGCTTQAVVPGTPATSALLNGLNVVIAGNRSGPLRIDVGPTSYKLIARVNAAEATVTESAQGSVLRLRLPHLHCATSASIAGFIGLDRLRLPATLEIQDGTAVLTAFVSGLAGTTPISSEFGRSGMQPTGLSLEISGVGEMRAIPTPTPPAKDSVGAAKTVSAAPSSRKGKPAKRKQRRATGPLARLRRAVPAPLEPSIRRISRNPLAQRVYRKLTGLAS